MKTLKLLFLIVTIASLLTGCAKDDELSSIEPVGPVLKSADITTESIEEMIFKIQDLVVSHELEQGIATALISKLENAIKSIVNKNSKVAENLLDAVLNQLESLIDSGEIEFSTGGDLIFDINEILGDWVPGQPFTDPRDGKVYQTIVIGNQCWMAENLKATKYNDGSDIPIVVDGLEWGNLLTPGCCYYNNDEFTGEIYGVLYNWFVIETGKLCPSGWHIPTDDEWSILTDYLGGEDLAACILKESGTMHWIDPNYCATNETGFSALPGGRRLSGGFGNLGGSGFWWSSTSYDANTAWYRDMGYYGSYVFRNHYYKKTGFSVRCIRD